MDAEHANRALGEERAQRPRHARRSEHLLHSGADQVREPPASVLGCHRQRTPTRFHIGRVRISEASRRDNRPVIGAAGTLRIACAVDRSYHILSEAGRLNQ